MSKKQTSGMPKPAPAKETATAAKQPRLIKEHHTKAERDAQVQRWLILGTSIVIGVAVLLLAVAVIVSVIAPTRPAATVNGDTITVGELQDQVRLERALRNVQLNDAVAQYRSFGVSDDQIIQFLQSQPPYSTWISEDSVPDQLGNTVLSQIIDDRLIAADAAAKGISVDEAAIESRVQDFFGYDPAALLNTPTPTLTPTVTVTPLVSPTPTLTPAATVTPEFTPTASVTPSASATPTATPNATEVAEQFVSVRDQYFSVLSSQSGLGQSQIEGLFEREALTQALRDAVTADLSSQQPFVNVRVIEVDSEASATTILAALNAGESFADLARANSSNDTAATGGELDWQSLTSIADTFGDDAKAALQDAAPGAFAGPVLTSSGTWAVFQVRATELRELTADELDSARNQAFEEYLNTLRDAADIQITDNWIGSVPLDPALSISSS